MRRRRQRIEGFLALARAAERRSRWAEAARLFRIAGDLMHGGDELAQARACEMNCLANLEVPVPMGGARRFAGAA